MTIAFVLSGGGSLGAVQVGMLQALAERNVRPDLLIGTSVGVRTSNPDVFAAGDVASAYYPGMDARLRVEHWANAAHQGATAAKNMLGIPSAYDRVPYFFSDQYELAMEYSGHATSWGCVVFRGNPADGKFIAFWLSRGVVVAGMNANVWDVTNPIQQLSANASPSTPPGSPTPTSPSTRS